VSETTARSQRGLALASWGLLASLILSGAAAAGQLNPKSVAAQIKAMTGSPMRLAWIRSTNGKEVMLGPCYKEVHNKAWIVVVFDTEEGRERVFSPAATPDTNCHPLITPDGRRLIWSRGRKDVFIADWNGSHSRLLGHGLQAIAVAEDPPGTEWVYVSEEEIKNDGVGYGRAVYRYQIDKPAVKELVWDKTPMFDKFEVSRDGKYVVTNFNYPNVGIADLPNGNPQIFGQGCMPALAPDNSFRMFYMLGGHTGIQLCDKGGTNGRYITFTNVPGFIGQAKQWWYPNWVKYDVRFMTMTGPWAGPPARANGNVYLGQFNEDFRSMKQWIRVTDSPEGETHLDAWLAPPGNLFIDATVNPTMSGEAKEPLTVTIRNDGEKNWKGAVRIVVPAGWTVEPAQAPCLVNKGTKQTVAFTLTPPATPQNGKFTFTAVVHNEAGKAVNQVSATARISHSSAAFVKQDTKTQGNWKGAYGAGGSSVVGDKESLPFGSITAAGNAVATWAAPTAEARALRRSEGNDRLAACWHGLTFTVDVSLTDKKEHQVAFYFLDWDADHRSQRVEVVDPATDAVLDTQTVSDFREGKYLVWKMKGRVIFKITITSGSNAVLSGLFFD